MKSNTARRKVRSFTHDGTMFKLTLECGHVAYRAGRRRDPPKTGTCPKWPDVCDIVARPIEVAVTLGDLGPVLGDS